MSRDRWAEIAVAVLIAVILGLLRVDAYNRVRRQLRRLLHGGDRLTKYQRADQKTDIGHTDRPLQP